MEDYSMHCNVIVIDQHFNGLNPMQFGHENCAPLHDFGPAVRTHWLLHYVVSGFGKFTREGVTYDIGPGGIFVIPPYMETYYQADKKLEVCIHDIETQNEKFKKENSIFLTVHYMYYNHL